MPTTVGNEEGEASSDASADPFCAIWTESFRNFEREGGKIIEGHVVSFG